MLKQVVVALKLKKIGKIGDEFYCWTFKNVPINRLAFDYFSLIIRCLDFVAFCSTFKALRSSFCPFGVFGQGLLVSILV